MVSFSYYFFLLLLLQFSEGDDNGSFTNPPTPNHDADLSSDVVWILGEKQILQWLTTYTVYNISLWQQNLTSNHAEQSSTPIFSYTQTVNVNSPGQYEWVVQTYEFDLRVSNVFFLGLNFAGANTGFTSHYFNISKSVPQSSLSAGSTSPTSSSALTTLPTKPSTTVQDVPSKPDTATKVGLGVGLGIGIPLLILFGALVGIQMVRARRSQLQEINGQPRDGATTTVDPKFQSQVLVEAPSRHQDPYELYAHVPQSTTARTPATPGF